MALHTYEFYKNRKNDPKWREEYLRARNERIIAMIILLIAVVIAVYALLFYMYASTHGVTLDNLSMKTFTGFLSYIGDNFRDMFSSLKERFMKEFD